jgi:spore maturation protein SpmA
MGVFIPILKRSFKTNPSGYSIRNNIARNTFALEDNAAFGMGLDVLRKMERICPSYHIKGFYMMRFRA